MPTNCVTGSQGGIHNGHSPPHLSREISEGLPPTPSFHGPQPPVPTSSVTNYNTETHDGLKTNVLDPLSNPGGFSSQLPLEASDRGSEHEILSLEGEANQITLKPAPSRIVPWAKPISPLSPISPLQSSVSLGGDEQSTDIARDLFWTQPLAHIQSLDGLDAPVTAMAFSPERSLFAVGLEYGRVDIWRLDPDSNLMLCTSRTVNSHLITSLDAIWQWMEKPRPILPPNFSANGYTPAEVSRDPDVLLWGAPGHDVPGASTPGPEFHRTGMIAISPNMDICAKRSSDNGDILLYDTASCKCKAILRGHSFGVASLCFSCDGRLLASASIDKQLNLWDTADGICVQKFQGNSSSPVVISPDSKLLASSSEDFTVKIWGVQEKIPLHQLSGHSARVLSLAFSTDSTVLASGSEDGVVQLWNVSSGVHLNIGRRRGFAVSSLAFLFNDYVLAIGTSNGNVSLLGQQERVTSSTD
jgi:WD40 repeat protein